MRLTNYKKDLLRKLADECQWMLCDCTIKQRIALTVLEKWGLVIIERDTPDDPSVRLHPNANNYI